MLACTNVETWGKRICCRLWSVDAHDQQKGLEFCWTGNLDDVEKSYDGNNSQWWSADAWRGHRLSKNWIYCWQMKVLENTPAVLSQGKLCGEHGHSYEWITGQNHISLKKSIRIQCNTENFVPIVVPGLSTSSSSSLPSSTSMTPSRQETDHPTSSSSSSTSPTMTSSTVSSESVVRQERRDLRGTDSYPVTVSSKPVERQPKIQNQMKTKTTIKNGETCVISTYRNGCKNSGRIWWMTKFHYREALTPVLLMKPLWSRLQRDVRIWVNTMFILTSRKTEIARSARGPKLQGPRAEDALAEPYLVQKT